MIIFECEVSPDSLRSGGMAPGADIRTTVLQVPMRYRKLGEIDGVTNIGIFEEVRMIDSHGLAKLKGAAHFHPRLQCIKRAQCRIDSKREGGTLYVGRRVCKNPQTLRVPLDPVEQQRPTNRAALPRPR